MGTPTDIKGLVAIIIASTFGIVLIVPVVGVVVTGRQLTPESTNLISTIAGALIGVLASYIGGKVSSPPTDPK